MTNTPVLFQGQHLRVRLLGSDNEWTYGVVEVASRSGQPNGLQSVGIRLDGSIFTPLGLTCGVLLLTIDEKAGSATGALDGCEYEVQTRVSPPPLEG
jgi:hypothetical protein